MNFEEFLGECRQTSYVDMKFGQETERSGGRGKVTKDGKPAFTTRYCTGGIGGGSCWDTVTPSYYARSSDEKADWSNLDIVLEKFAPNISYLHFLKLSELMKSKSWIVDEYYGNSTDYTEEYLYVDEVYDFLNKHGYLGDEVS